MRFYVSFLAAGPNSSVPYQDSEGPYSSPNMGISFTASSVDYGVNKYYSDLTVAVPLSATPKDIARAVADSVIAAAFNDDETVVVPHDIIMGAFTQG